MKTKKATSSNVLTHRVVITPREDLGMRAPMIARLGARMAKHRASKLSEWLGDPQKTRRKREELLAAVGYQPDPVPFRARVVREEILPHARRRHYKLQINADEEINAILALPRDASPSN